MLKCPTCTWPSLARRLLLRSLLVLPFALQIFAAVGLTGWLSIRNGQQAVNEVVRKIKNKVAKNKVA
ncbi:hypothetical protein [Thermoleptolyngbya sp. C42_A2020_037]|uniref:hypothetical protein n=1 Tax=Thermoleptolyngbya sp. C42_A2020_037 TaxID=2747799 RepID=UPI0019F2740F|nr:hypothetical protein [Thermoleptolyngbya sp. C42_A2020_037]MBF2084289.1 hypothetical protein [Thermoleptolyngbya sp. C42_A2020_037]